MPRLACLTAIHSVSRHFTAPTALPTPYTPNSSYFLLGEKNRFQAKIIFQINYIGTQLPVWWAAVRTHKWHVENDLFLNSAVKFVDFFVNINHKHCYPLYVNLRMRHNYDLRKISGASSKISGIGDALRTTSSSNQCRIETSQFHKSFEGIGRSHSRYEKKN